MKTNQLKFLALIIMSLAPFQQASASRHGDLVARHWNSQIDEMVSSLPKDVQENFERIYDRRWTVRTRPSTAMPDQCFRMRQRQESPSESVRRARYFEFSLYKECLDSDVLRAKSVKDQNQIEKDFKRELFRNWIARSKSKFKSQLYSLFYKNSFFLMSEDFGLNIEGSIEDISADLIALTWETKDRNPEFLKVHPDVAYYVTEMFSQKNPDLREIEKAYRGPRSVQALQIKARVKSVMEANEAWFVRYHMIKNAKKSIRVQSYSLFDDLYGRAFVALLLEAMEERNVEVKLMLDGRGSILTSRSDLVEMLVRRGAKVSSYNPMLLNSLNVVKYFQAGPVDAFLTANHDKLLIVDDTKVLTGGRNIGDRYFIHVGEGEGRIYRDMEVYAECDRKALDSILAFNIEFYSSNSIDVTDLFSGARKREEVMLALRTIEARMKGETLSAEMVRTYPQVNNFNSLSQYSKYDPTPSLDLVPVSGLDKTSALLDESTLTEELFKQIDHAQSEIFIMNPYVILTDRMRTRLTEASNRGVKISIVTTSPTSTDSLLTQARLIAEWKEMMETIPNLQIYGAIGPEQLHSKAFVFDQKVSLIGSYNLDSLSENNNSEFALLIQSPEFSKEVRDFMYDYAVNKSLAYDPVKGIGPQDVPGATKPYKRLKRLRWFSNLIRPWL